jgi:hypothetical protein
MPPDSGEHIAHPHRAGGTNVAELRPTPSIRTMAQELKLASNEQQVAEEQPRQKAQRQLPVIGGTWGYLSLAEVAARWSCHPNTARRLLTGCDRKLFGSMVRYSIADIEAIERGATVVSKISRNVAKSTRGSRSRVSDSDSLAALRKRFGL